MNKQFYVLSVLSAAMLLAACEGDDGTNGTNGTNGVDGSDGADGFNSLIAIRDIPKGDAVCLGGGRAADSGLDTNRNDVLDAEEVTATEILECEATPTVRALHAVPDAPAVNIFVNDALALPVVDYAVGSGFVPVIEENNVRVEAIIPGADDLAVIDEDYSLPYSTETTLIAVGTVGGGITALPITNASDSRITDGSFRAQVVHAAPSAPAVDVYVTAFDADLAASAPVTGAGTPLAFGENTPQLEVTAGDYQIRVTGAGAPAAVVYDSGEISLAAGADLMLVAVENTGPGDNLVQLVVLDGAAASILNDTNTPASVVAAHLSPDAPAVDILADDNSTGAVENIALTRNVSFPAACELSAVPAGDYTISIAANADNNVVPLTFPLVLDQGSEATAIVSGFLSGNDPAITALPLAGNTRSVATETKLRITHGSPSTGNVDLYLVPANTDISMMDPSIADVPFGASTMQMSIGSGIYDAIVTPAGTKTFAITLEDLDFTVGGAVLDVIARDPATDGSEGTAPLAFVIDYATVAACPAP